ncbi:MAG: hypothetical protein J7647_31975 [Cyanobacteria bacterium SBLK]|nr:hypothetical protein [Cyanobacteria bacterium SBLK]
MTQNYNVDVDFLFPTLVGRSYLLNSESINNRLAQFILESMRTARDVSNATTVNQGWQSPLGFLNHDLAEIKTLRAFINQSIESFLPQYGKVNHSIEAPPQFSYSYESWAVVLNQGGFQHEHTHTRTDFVGVYCVAIPPLDEANQQNGNLTLLDPRAGRLATRPSWEAPHAPIVPTPGCLVLFPSYLPHRVDCVTTNGNRITINFDVTLTPIQTNL